MLGLGAAQAAATRTTSAQGCVSTPVDRHTPTKTASQTVTETSTAIAARFMGRYCPVCPPDASTPAEVCGVARSTPRARRGGAGWSMSPRLVSTSRSRFGAPRRGERSLMPPTSTVREVRGTQARSAHPHAPNLVARDREQAWRYRPPRSASPRPCPCVVHIAWSSHRAPGFVGVVHSGRTAALAARPEPEWREFVAITPRDVVRRRRGRRLVARMPCR